MIKIIIYDTVHVKPSSLIPEIIHATCMYPIDDTSMNNLCLYTHTHTHTLVNFLTDSDTELSFN